MSKQEDKRYQYFDTPEGQDLDKKLWCALRPATATLVVLGTCDVMLHSHPKTYLGTLARFGSLAVPILGTTTAFVLTSNTLCNIRKKDDEVNWVGGAWAAATVLGAYARQTRIGIFAALGFTAIAMVHKQYRMEGIDPLEFKMVPQIAGVKLQPERTMWPEKMTFKYEKYD